MVDPAYTTMFRFEGPQGQPRAISPWAPILSDLPSQAFRGFNVAFTTSVAVQAPDRMTHTTSGRKGAPCLLPVSGAPGPDGLLPWQMIVPYRRGDAELTVVIPARGDVAEGNPITLDLGVPLAGEHVLEVSVGVVLDRSGEAVRAPQAAREHWASQALALNRIGSNAALSLHAALHPVANVDGDVAALALLRAQRRLICWPVIPFDTSTLRTTRSIVIDPAPKYPAWIRVAIVRDLDAWRDAVRRHAAELSQVEETDPVAAAVSAAEARALFVERYWVPGAV